MLNQDKKFVKSEGVDLPIMYVYLAGRIAGNCIEKCLKWRQDIISHYTNYNGKGVYPIAFLDALNSKEADSIDKLGLTSAVPPNLIYDKDLMSVKRADVIVCYMEDFMEDGIEELLDLIPENDVRDVGPKEYCQIEKIDYKKEFFKLKKAILNRRPNYGTNSEMAWGLLLGKPVILIAGTEKRKKMLELHPFTKKASVIVKDVEELLEGKYLNLFYKSIASSVY